MSEANGAAKTANLTIQGFQFSLELPYKEGDTINANEAAAINQTFAENIRNNFAAQLKSMKAEVARANEWMKEVDGKQVPDIDRVTNDDLDMEAVQAAYDAYVAEYEFGARRVGSTRGPVDPVEREARRIAGEKVKELLRANNYKIGDVPKDKMDALIDQALEQYPQIRANAAAVVEANKGLDLAGLSL